MGNFQEASHRKQPRPELINDRFLCKVPAPDLDKSFGFIVGDSSSSSSTEKPSFAPNPETSFINY